MRWKLRKLLHSSNVDDISWNSNCFETTWPCSYIQWQTPIITLHIQIMYLFILLHPAFLKNIDRRTPIIYIALLSSGIIFSNQVLHRTKEFLPSILLSSETLFDYLPILKQSLGTTAFELQTNWQTKSDFKLDKI